MIKKTGFFFLSLWLLFVMIIIITIKIPVCFSKDCSFVGIRTLLSTNIIPICCSLALFIGAFSYFSFKNQLEGTKELTFRITKIESVDYEHLTFLTTYIIPLVCFQFEQLRYVIVFVILLIVIGLIYIRTDIFYTNPTLALMKFRIYKVTGTFRREVVREDIIIITKEELSINDDVKYIKLDKRIYYASKVKIT